MSKPRLLSAITSTGKLTIGNYIGAIKNMVALQDKYDVFVFVANLHAIVTLQKPDILKENIKNLVALYVACGLDPKKVTLFAQSDVLEHSQLGHILLCHTTMGELSRMTQFKDKSANLKQDNNTESIPTGLFTYPTLMAADILLYDSNIVPVGNDQKQHLELTRNIAQRMNNKYGPLFTIPQHYFGEVGQRIMDLQDPTVKMSKSSSNPKTYISLLDSEAEIRNKIKIAVTDSENKVYYDVENKPGISNLLNIYCGFTNTTIKEAEILFQEANYGVFKDAVANVIVKQLLEIQRRYQQIIDNNEWKKILENGKNNATKIASKKLKQVQNAIGINY